MKLKELFKKLNNYYHLLQTTESTYYYYTTPKIKQTNKNIVLLPKDWEEKTILSNKEESRVQFFAINWQQDNKTYWFPFLIYIPKQLDASAGYIDIDTKHLQQFGEENKKQIESLALQYASILNKLGYNITNINITSNNNQHTHPSISNFSSMDFAQDGPLKFSNIDIEYFALLYCFQTKKQLSGAICKRVNNEWNYENLETKNIDLEIGVVYED